MTDLAAALDRRAPLVRLARTGVVGLVVCGTAAVAHTAAGGTVDPRALLGLAAVVSAVALVLTGRELAPGQVLGLMLLGQGAMHVTSHDATMAGWPLMLVTHLVATGASLWLATRAESWLVDLAERLVGRVRGPVVLAIPTIATVGSTRRAWSRSGLEPVALVEGRGPPVGC